MREERYHNALWIKSITGWATFSLLLVFSAQVFAYARMPRAFVSYEVQHSEAGLEDPVGQRCLFTRVAGDSSVILFALQELTTPTAVTSVTSPTATVVSPVPTDTASPSPALPPAQPTDTVSPPTPADTVAPTVTVGAGETSATATQPAIVAPAATPLQPEASPLKPTQKLATATAAAAPATQPAISTQEVTTDTTILEPGAEAPTTYTARVAAPWGSLLDRLTYNKPGIWGNKAFYVGLAVVYVVLLVLFFRLLFQLGRQED